ncbi:MAG: protease complex subunit PrcB family protein [Vicingaceae bacterium]|nr:protease complex subunit PrcB family protein [Vicingaceae bacterium]
MKNILILISILGLLSCKSSQSSTSSVMEKVVFTPIELKSGNNGGFKTKTNLVISTQEEFLKIWNQAFANYMNKETAPEVDFEKNIILLVALGEKTSGGYTIKVDNVIETKDNTVVNVLYTSPGKGCMTTESITYPFQIIQIEKPNKAILFSKKNIVFGCESE